MRKKTLKSRIKCSSLTESAIRIGWVKSDALVSDFYEPRDSLKKVWTNRTPLGKSTLISSYEPATGWFFLVEVKAGATRICCLHILSGRYAGIGTAEALIKGLMSYGDLKNLCEGWERHQ